MAAMATTESGYGGPRNWTFLTNHGHVLLAIARNPTARLRDVAEEVGVTERAAQAIVNDLETGGYLSRTRVGRRNQYTINPTGRFRHPAEADQEVGALLALFTESPPRSCT
ncbi:helix-turn-helix transcriptional regulator [Micromonospora costi]|uniref:MarR family transcriptional regulator n=1 Tax=Micromonospora costi TaxID=1530042 RepID=A0A3B0AE56_9ACTN|nr:MarR family transcriptional regulator [Micromonospora costi]